jgi:phage shock protein A
MPEDEIAQAEIAALTRRFEERADKTDREFGIVKSDLTALRLQIGNLDQKIDSFIAEQQAVNAEQQAANAQLVDLLTRLVGRDPDA